jgi:hypothetical protein
MEIAGGIVVVAVLSFMLVWATLHISGRLK